MYRLYTCIYMYTWPVFTWCAEKQRQINILLKRPCFFTKPLILGIGASKVLPIVGISLYTNEQY